MLVNSEGEKFVRQFQIDGYVADLALPDRSPGASNLTAASTTAIRDAARTAIIERYGYRVLRFWNAMTCSPTRMAVLESIRQELLLARDRPD